MALSAGDGRPLIELRAGTGTRRLDRRATGL